MAGTTTRRARAGAQWLALREPADADARAADLVGEIQARIRPTGTTTVHDLGCGTGSMARWLAGRLPGRQHWLMYDRDPVLLAHASTAALGVAADGAPITGETRRRDITRLAPGELDGADLVTASALLDVLTAVELDRMLSACVGTACPVLITLSVTGRVELTPADPLDRHLADAFNAHQRRTPDTDRLLGPDAVGSAVDALTGHGMEVLVRPSPWRLGPEQPALVEAWLAGWLAAAGEQEPRLAGPARAYARRRRAEAAGGRLSIVVDHLDLLALPSRARGPTRGARGRTPLGRGAAGSRRSR